MILGGYLFLLLYLSQLIFQTLVLEQFFLELLFQILRGQLTSHIQVVMIGDAFCDCLFSRHHRGDFLCICCYQENP